jgi:crotonobetainyl-CoA:carnitine CoA-transferase CaiB-like acyl-CoA transferase
MGQALKGVRILELGQIIAGTYGGQILSDMGAEVIKIEAPAGDLGRNPSVAPFKGHSGLFLTFNRNKKSVVIDLKSDDGRATFLDLVRQCDVVVDNFRPGVMERLGIPYPVLQATNPRIIHCAITGFGSEGDYRDYPALDIIIQSMSGHMAVTGEPGRPPVRLGLPLADLSGGIFSSQGILAALYERERTGLGQHLELAMFDAMLSLLTYMGTMWLSNGELPPPPGSAHEYTVPWQAFRTSDSWLVLAIREEKMWRGFCTGIGRADLAADPRFSTNASRVANRAVLVPLLEALIAERSTADWLALCRAHNVPAGPVNHFDGAFGEPPALQNGAVVAYDHPDVGTVRLPAYPVKMKMGAPEAPSTPAPRLGEHTDSILAELLSYSPDRIAALKASRAVISYQET